MRRTVYISGLPPNICTRKLRRKLPKVQESGFRRSGVRSVDLTFPFGTNSSGGGYPVTAPELILLQLARTRSGVAFGETSLIRCRFARAENEFNTTTQNENLFSFPTLTARGSVGNWAVLIVGIVSLLGSALRAQESGINAAPVNTVIGTVNVGSEPFGVVVSPNNQFLYASNYVGPSVSVIDSATNTVQTTISSDLNPPDLPITSHC